MYASELVGMYAIRRSVTILSEEGKLMDTSYTDPNKPVYIKDYKDGKIILLSFDGYRTILTGEYDDDKWVGIHDRPRYNNVIIPVGYKSVNAVYKYMDQIYAEKRNAMLSVFDQTASSVLHAILDTSLHKEGDPYIVIKLYVDNEVYIVVRMFAKVLRTRNGSKALYSFEESDEYDLYDTDRLVVVKNDQLFTDGVTRLIRENIFDIGNINAVRYATSSKFGYDGINKEKDLLVSFNEPKFIIIISTIGIYKVFVVDKYMYINPITSEQLEEIESQYITAILDMNESVDLENKMKEGHYKCDYLRIG